MSVHKPDTLPPRGDERKPDAAAGRAGKQEPAAPASRAGKQEPAAPARRGDGKRPWAAARRANKREAFLAAARKIFAAKGFQAANVTDIVAEVESGQGTFYYHFKDKQAVFDELMIGFVDELTRVLIENNADSRGRPALAHREQAVRNARAIARVYMENYDLAQLFFKESRYVGGAAMERIQDFYGFMFGEIENGLRQGLDAGLVRPELDPAIAARCFVGAAELAVFEALKDRDRAPDLDRIAEQIVDFQTLGVMGLRPPGAEKT